MMDKFYKVEGHSGIVKNPVTGTIINTNKTEITAAKKRKMSRIQKEQEKEQLTNDVAELKSQMSEVMDLLKKMVEK